MAMTAAFSPDSAEFFDVSPVPPHGGSTEFSLYLWEKVRDAGISPASHSGYSDNDDLRLEFLRGARLMGYELVDPDDAAEFRRKNPRLNVLKPQQLQIADTLNKQFDEYGVEIPRRGTKTTTIFIWLVGRCLSRPGYFVTFSAQSGIMGSRRLREWGNRLESINPEDERKPAKRRAPQALALFGEDAIPETPSTRPFTVMRGEVGKGIYFDNGSQFLVLKPDADAYRSEGADVSWLDEAQEKVFIEDGEALLAAILPLQDTKEDSSLIISGTAGEVRMGIFWEIIDRLRNGVDTTGGIDFAAPEDTPWEAIEKPAGEARAMELLKQVHPGIGTLTTMAKMLANYRKLPTPKWAREYLSLWPETFGTAVIDLGLWEDARLTRKLARPTRVAFGFAVKPNGGSAAIVAAWRSPSGIAYLEIVEHQSGTKWLPEFGAKLSQKYRSATIAFDDIGQGAASALEMQNHARKNRMPTPKLEAQAFRDTAAGAIQILRDLEYKTLRHFDQVSLNDAVEHVAKREVRGAKGVFLWAPTEPGGDIVVWDAATLALRNWDQHFASRKSGSTKPYMGE